RRLALRRPDRRDGRRRGRPRPAPGRDPDPRRANPDGGRRRPGAPGADRARLRRYARFGLNATAVLPVKRFAAAKQRLAAGITGERRRELAAAMVADVLEAIGGARTVERVIVVSGDPIAQELAAAAGAEVVPDPEDAGHVEAAQAGIA